MYAQINRQTIQMVGPAMALPTRWTTPQGATIAGFDTLPRAALAALDWVPVVRQGLPDPQTHRHAAAPAYDAERDCFVYRAEPVDVELLRAQALAALDEAASAASGRHLTVGVGQELRYQAKAAEARELLREGDMEPDPARWPLLAAEALALGEALGTRAQAVATAHGAWLAVAARIEAARVSGKAQVRGAGTGEAVLAARDAALAALEAL